MCDNYSETLLVSIERSLTEMQSEQVKQTRLLDVATTGISAMIVVMLLIFGALVANLIALCV